ncbi:unnamed protein product [Debaryomyces tyrocola]|nr:unnamed protein product [Debaryomyces tyrocola]
MNSVYSALSLALIGEKRFVLTTNDYENTVFLFQTLLQESCQFNSEDICEVDVKHELDNNSVDLLIRQMIYWDENMSGYAFKNVVIWRNMEKLSHEQQKVGLFPLLNQIDEYDTTVARTNPQSRVQVGSFVIRKPSMFIIVPLIESEHAHPPVYQYVKEKFWFGQNFHYRGPSDEKEEIDYCADYAGLILEIRNVTRPQVYASPEIQRYIYSLVVHARNHRLCSLAPIQSRLSTRTIDAMQQLSECMVAWKKHGSDRLFVTPDYCKIAMRKIGYWLIDWEHDSIFSTLPDCAVDADLDYRRQLEISMLTGDWYGSDWKYVKKYLETYKTDTNASNYINKIVEDVLQSVRPPI